MNKRKTSAKTATTTMGQAGDTAGTGATGQTGATAGAGATGATATGGKTTGTTPKKPAHSAATPPLYAPLLRNMVDDQFAGMALHGDDLRVALDQPADPLNQTALSLGHTGNILPLNVLTPATRPIYARLQQDGQDNLARKTAGAMQLAGLLPTVEGTTAGVLIELLDKKGAYGGFKLLGDRVHDSAMDLRLIYGTFEYYLIDQVMQYLEARMADPYLTHTEQEALLDHFGPALIKLNGVLTKGPESKAQLATQRDQAGAQAQDAAAEANLQTVTYQLHNNIPPQRTALLEAAQRHMQKQAAAAGAQGAQVTGTQATATERKVLR